MKTVKIGLIGLGEIGRAHFYNCFRMKNVRLVAVADTSKKSRLLAKAKGVRKVFDHYEKLFEDPAIDCVIISLPTFLHAECAIRAMEHGKHVFVEKPLARNVKEGKEIVEKAQKTGVKTMVGYPMLFSRFATAKEEIDEGLLGDVVYANAVNVGSGPFSQRSSGSFIPSPVPSWWFKPELAGGGALIDLGSHLINLLRWYFGDEIASVKSVLGHRFNMPTEDSALCFLKFKRGVLATINVGWYSLQKIVKIELFGTAKVISMDSSTKRGSSQFIQLLGVPTAESLSFYNELNHFIRCVANDKLPFPSAEEGLKDLEIVSLAYRNEIKL